jgi:hypothetical protein
MFVLAQAPPVLSQLSNELDGYTMTKSALHFPVDRPLAKSW